MSHLYLRDNWYVNLFVVSLPPEMKNLLKYSLLLAIAVVLFNVTAISGNAHHRESLDEKSRCEKAEYHIASSNSMPDMCIPKEEYTVTSNISEQSNFNRTEVRHRHGSNVVKSGKSIESGLVYNTQKKSLLFHSSLIEPAHILVRLHRLII